MTSLRPQLAQLLPDWAAGGVVVRQRDQGPGGLRAVLRVADGPAGDCHVKVYAQPALAEVECALLHKVAVTADATVGPSRVLASGPHWLAVASVETQDWPASDSDLERWNAIRHSVGRWLARLHRLAGDDLPAADMTLADQAAANMAYYGNRDILGSKLADAAVTALSQAQSRVPAGRKCLVHGDFSHRQCLVSRQDGRVSVIDFLTARQGWPEDDVAFWIAKERQAFLGGGMEAREHALLSGYGPGLDMVRLKALSLVHMLRMSQPLKWRGHGRLLPLLKVPATRVRWRALVEGCLVDLRAAL